MNQVSFPRVQRVVLDRQSWERFSPEIEYRNGDHPVTKPICWCSVSCREDVARIQEFSQEMDSLPILLSSENELRSKLEAQDCHFWTNLRVLGVWDGGENSLPEFFYVADGPELAPLDLIPFDATIDQFSRVEGIFESNVLKKKAVCVVGLGSFGSVVADNLARCGCGIFELFDPDRLDPANISRHICDLRDIGRLKVDAVAERLRAINPEVQITTHPTDILEQPDELLSAMERSDIVAVSTDSSASRYISNELSIKSGTTTVYAGAYERALGGHVLRVVPGETGCYECVFGALVQALGAIPEAITDRVPYSNQSSDDFTAEPGLGIDAHMIALIQAKMILLTLVRDEDTTLEDFPADFIIWGNSPGWIFQEHLIAQFAATGFSDKCSTCGLD